MTRRRMFGAVAVGCVVLLAGAVGKEVVRQAALHREFFLRARALGLGEEEARAILEEELLCPGTDGDVWQRANTRLYQVAEGKSE